MNKITKKSCCHISTAWIALALLAGAAAPVRADVFLCNADTVYALDQVSREIRQVSVATAAWSPVATLPPAPGTSAWNALAIGANGGDVAYAMSTAGSSPGRVVAYDAATSVSTVTASAGAIGANAWVAGAVNPVNGWYYSATPMVNISANVEWALLAYDPATGTTAPIRVGTITDAVGNNGDLAFDSLGNLYLLAGNVAGPATYPRIYRIDGSTIPTTAGTTNLPATAVTPTFSALDNYAGLAFNFNVATNAMQLVAAQGSLAGDVTYRQFDPATGLEVGSFVSTQLNDMASCQYPNTIRLQQTLPDGRVAPGDQFSLTVTGGGLSTGNSATTTGSASGLQTPMAGPVLAQTGAVYTVTLGPAGTTNLANYASSLQCVNTTDASVIPVTVNPAGTSGSFTMPAASGGAANVLCTFNNPFPAPGVSVSKTAGTPTKALGANPSTVDAGDTIAYTFTVTNTGNVPLTGVAVNDPALDAPATCLATTLAVGGSTTCTGTHTITAAEVTAGQVANTATATGTPPTGPTVTSPPTSAVTVPLRPITPVPTLSQWALMLLAAAMGAVAVLHLRRTRLG